MSSSNTMKSWAPPISNGLMTGVFAKCLLYIINDEFRCYFHSVLNFYFIDFFKSHNLNLVLYYNI